MWLRFKIFIGYITLIALLSFTIYFFRKEQMKRNCLQQDEQELLHFWHLTGEAYAGLLDLATYGETVSVWDENDRSTYQKRRDEVCGTLQSLKQYVHTSEQRVRIDSLCLFLERKEQLLDTVMHTFSRFRSVGEIINRKIPMIASCARDDRTFVGVKEEIPKKSFWSFLKREKRKSVYSEQKEKRGQLHPAETDRQISTAGMLYSLNRELAGRRETERGRLLVQMERLYNNNMALNCRLYGIIRDFESETDRRLEERYMQFFLARERSFYTVSTFAVFISLLTIFLYIIIHRELNQRNRYQRQLEISNKENRELIQSRKRMMLTIAHDLRSPLAIIRGTAELLPGEQERAMQEEYAGNIRHASDYMLSLVDTLMDFYLLDTGQFRENVSIFRLESLFREIADNHAPLVKKKGLRMMTRFSGMDAVVYSDRGHLQQIVNNLLSNALKFTDEGSVTIRVDVVQGRLVFSVRDTGRGIGREEKERIFQEFVRLRSAQGVDGFGLGLSIVDRLVKLLGGAISLDSAPGQGSKFIVTVPVGDAAEGAAGRTAAPEPGAAEPLPPLRALLVDDDPLQLEMVAAMCRRAGVSAECCQYPEYAARLVEGGRFDLVVTDIQMPSYDGFGVLEAVRGVAPGIPVVAVSARGEMRPEDFAARGFAACLRKPFTYGELVGAIRAACCGGTSPQVPDAGTKASAPEPDGGELRFDALTAYAGDDAEAAQSILASFAEQTAANCTALCKALDADDAAGVKALAHKMLPIFTMLGAGTVADTLRRAETHEGALTDTLRRELAAVAERIRGIAAEAGKRAFPGKAASGGPESE